MTTFILESKIVTGAKIEFYYDDNDRLCGFRVIGNYEKYFDFAKRVMNENYPIKEFRLPIHKDKSFTVTEVQQEITFDMFWNMYDNKLASSKKRTLTKWNKLSKADQIKAYNHISVYFRTIPSGCEKKYAETYLNAELWNN